MTDQTSFLIFDNPDALAAWLAAGGVPLAAWGRGGAKTVADLWAEVACGETTLGDAPPRRAVDVVQVLIGRGQQTLTEIEQAMADGRRRVRGWPPSEKLKRGENPLVAARRCLAEELGITVSPGTLCEGVPAYEHTVDSPSYPGLPTTYRVHTVTIAAADLPDALPDADFWRDNAAPADPVRQHLWGWR
jgi:8-oxo-dGTP pyrophosphatase MutT (NUDIX family)